ncbi:MAG: T9SS type A sorting domain-containing protein, partial [Phaeodactylibacter sp.]|nr:T9SS type A sorting domain-containing protein [Phaeodactylibacter sp.]
TDTAFLVVIRDTLDSALDPLSIRPGAASHPYTVSMEAQGIVVFTFENILLPDSTSNETGSHGFVKFRIAQTPNNPDGTIISNRAAIYFDYNAPVITNTTHHQIGTDYIIIDLVDETASPEGYNNKLEVFPNPAAHEITFRLDADEYGPFLLQVFDAKGRAITARTFNGRIYQMDALSLVPGFYFFRLKNEYGWQVSGKLIIIR